MAAGQANREDGGSLGPPLLQGTQAAEDLEAVFLTGGITSEDGGTNLTPAIHPVTGSNTFNVVSRRVNIIMWFCGCSFLFIRPLHEY